MGVTEEDAWWYGLWSCKMASAVKSMNYEAVLNSFLFAPASVMNRRKLLLAILHSHITHDT